MYATHDDFYVATRPRPSCYALSISLAIAVGATGASSAFIFDRIDHLPGIEARAQPGEYTYALTNSPPAPSLAAMTPIPAPLPEAIPVTPNTSGSEMLKASMSGPDAQQVAYALDADETAAQLVVPTLDSTPVGDTDDETRGLEVQDANAVTPHQAGGQDNGLAATDNATAPLSDVN